MAGPALNWGGSHVRANGRFDLEAAVKEACSQEGCYDDDLLFLTPATSPETTPLSSPLLLPVDLRTEPSEVDTLMGVSSPPSPTMPATVLAATVEPLDLDRPIKKRKLDVEDLGDVELGPSTNSKAPNVPKKTGVVRKREKTRANRKEKRGRERDARLGGPAPREKARKKYAGSADLLFTDLDMREAEVTSTAYTALDDRVRGKKSYTLDELVGVDSKWKFVLQKWDGKYVSASSFCT